MRDQAIRLDPSVKDPIALHYRMIEQVYRRKDEFDVLHSHLDYFPLSLLTRQNVPFLTTLHGRLDLADYVEIFDTFRDAPFVSISNNQRKPVPQLNWLRTVPHGVPANLLTPQPVKQEYARVSRPHFAGERRRQGDPHRRPRRDETEDRGQGR